MFDRIITKTTVTLSSSTFSCVTDLLGFADEPLAYSRDIVNDWHGLLSPRAESLLPGGRTFWMLFGYYTTGAVFRRYSVPFRTTVDYFK
jgi:hypothetical protein